MCTYSASYVAREISTLGAIAPYCVHDWDWCSSEYILFERISYLSDRASILLTLTMYVYDRFNSYCIRCPWSTLMISAQTLNMNSPSYELWANWKWTLHLYRSPKSVQKRTKLKWKLIIIVVIDYYNLPWICQCILKELSASLEGLRKYIYTYTVCTPYVHDKKNVSKIELRYSDMYANLG